jgi:hypothetical protein
MLVASKVDNNSSSERKRHPQHGVVLPLTKWWVTEYDFGRSRQPEESFASEVWGGKTMTLHRLLGAFINWKAAGNGRYK